MKIILAEFGRKPNLNNLKEYFKDITVYSNEHPLFSGPRYGWRMNDYYKVKRLLDYNQLVCSFDSDMHIISEDIHYLEELTKTFGLCLPINPRYMVKVDANIGADGDKTEESCAHAVNMSPIAFDPFNDRAREVLNTYCKLMISDPRRGPLVMWRAIKKTGFMPCLLPPQWCICREHIGVGNEIILHTGHEEVREHYKISR